MVPVRVHYLPRYVDINWSTVMFVVEDMMMLCWKGATGAGNRQQATREKT